jgi:hypothetical protein
LEKREKVQKGGLIGKNIIDILEECALAPMVT